MKSLEASSMIIIRYQERTLKLSMKKKAFHSLYLFIE